MTKTQGSIMSSTEGKKVLEKGTKYDIGKLRYDLIPAEVLEGLAEVLTYGANKYADDNWKHVPMWKYEAAMFRHINDWRKGLESDEESRLHHLKHALANVAFLLYSDLRPDDVGPLTNVRKEIT